MLKTKTRTDFKTRNVPFSKGHSLQWCSI